MHLARCQTVAKGGDAYSPSICTSSPIRPGGRDHQGQLGRLHQGRMRGGACLRPVPAARPPAAQLPTYPRLTRTPGTHSHLQGLAAAIPALEASVKALSTLKKADTDEVRQGWSWAWGLAGARVGVSVGAGG